MKLDASIMDYKEEIGKLLCGGDGHELSGLEEDLRGMVNNPEFSDVSFLCSDGVHVHACRMFLAGRSSVFKQLLSNGMSETRSRVVQLPSIQSSTMIQVLTFLYAGELKSSNTELLGDTFTSKTDEETDEGSNDPHFSGHDWKALMDVLSAAQFFLLDGLAKFILRRIWDWLRGEVTVHGMLSEDFLNRVANGLTTLCAYSSSSVEGSRKEARLIEATCIRMVQVLVSSDMSELTLSKLSRKAFTYYLDKTQNPPSDDKVWKYSLEEYKKLIQLLAWSTSKAGERPKLLCLPGLFSAGKFLLDGNESELFRTSRKLTQNRQRLSTDIVKKNVHELLPFIDLASVHPELLVQVIKPLKIMDAEVVAALGLQAVRTSRLFRISESFPEKRPHNWYITHEGRLSKKTPLGYVVFKMEPNISNGVKTVQTFMANSPMHSYGTYKWRVGAQEDKPDSPFRNVPPASGFEFGFLHLYPGEELTSDAVSTPLSSKTGFAMHVTDDLQKIEYSEGPWKAIWNLQEPFNLRGELEIQLDRVQDICTVSYNGCVKSVGLKMPEGGIMYPAICLPDPNLAVSIWFLEGFDRHVIYNSSSCKGGEVISPLP